MTPHIQNIQIQYICLCQLALMQQSNSMRIVFKYDFFLKKSLKNYTYPKVYVRSPSLNCVTLKQERKQINQNDKGNMKTDQTDSQLAHSCQKEVWK